MSAPFRIAHLSDLHVLALDGAGPLRFLNKRITGYANVRFRRGHSHKTEVVETLFDDLRNSAIDHVAITGDVSNLSLESEFERVKRLLDERLGFGPDQVTLVPGNHDIYTRGAMRSHRFFNYFAAYLKSDLPELVGSHPSGGFPVVKLRGPAAIIGLSSAVARAPLIATGKLGREQLDALERVFAHPEVRARTPILLAHHPVLNPPSRIRTLTAGLEDADELIKQLAGLERGLVLHGHLHGRLWRKLPTRTGVLDVLGATSASLVHPDPRRMAGYNVYELTADGFFVAAEAHVLDVASGQVIRSALPRPARSA